MDKEQAKRIQAMVKFDQGYGDYPGSYVVKRNLSGLEKLAERTTEEPETPVRE